VITSGGKLTGMLKDKDILMAVVGGKEDMTAQLRGAVLSIF
jgi:hypothetical protein